MLDSTPTTARLLAIALSASVLAAGCERTTAAPGPGDSGGPASKIVLASDARGPAPQVTGARPGGTLTVLMEDDFEHLDPGRAYVSTAQLANQVLQRTLTAYRRTPDGTVELVGDLATDTGRPSDGGRVWTFTLRDDLAFEDGTPITSADVAYGIARAFSPALPDGPTWLQQWLAGDPDFAAKYRGPFDGGAALPPGVSTPDRKTIVFRFATPQPDLPFVAALGTTTPVPRAKDTKADYDRRPIASGPYRIETYHRGDKMVLVRNKHWNAATDPVRHAYPDRMVFAFGQTPATSAQRLLNENAADATAISWSSTPAELLPQVFAAKELSARATNGPTPYVGYLKINTQRVRDVAVRRALNCAFDRLGYIKVIGGTSVARPATTMLPQLVSGWRNYDAYDCGPTGDTARAKKMLGDRKVRLAYGFRNTARGQKQSAFMQDTLGKAGFEVAPVPVDPGEYYATIGRKDTKLDVFMATASPDWPTGGAMLPPLLDGRTIAARGNLNTSYFDDPAVNAEIDRIRGLADLTAASKAWSTLEERVMREHAPLVPVYYDRTLSLNGSKVGGLYMDPLLGGTSLVNAFTK